jgi:hypothetical protein
LVRKPATIRSAPKMKMSTFGQVRRGFMARTLRQMMAECARRAINFPGLVQPFIKPPR